jgi:hypothetical protein
LCFLPFIESLLALTGSGNSHITWIRFLGAGQYDPLTAAELEDLPEAIAETLDEVLLTLRRNHRELAQSG